MRPADPGRPAGSTPPGPILRVDSLSIHRGSKAVLDRVSFEVALAGCAVVLGPNGAGKTTLLQAISGLETPADGRIEVRGAPAPTGGRPRFAFVFQRPVLLRRSVLANVEHALGRLRLARGERRARARRALLEVGLADFADRAARSLSGGEQQRLAIARANVLEPDCLVLDEPCAHLDPAAIVEIDRLLLRLNRAGRGILMSTHDVPQARRLAETVVFLHCGKVLETARAAGFFDGPASREAASFIGGGLPDDPRAWFAAEKPLVPISGESSSIGEES